MKRTITAFLFLLAFALAWNQAAAKPTGTVPVVPPLQPAPQGVKANLSGSIDFGDKSSLPQPSETSKSQVQERPEPALPVSDTEKQPSTLWILIFSLISAGLIAGAWWQVRRDAERKKTK